MRKNIARKCLCIALASAMMLGEAGTAMAASVENAADGRTAATVAAEEQADVAAANVSIWYAGAYKNSRTITINASGRAYRPYASRLSPSSSFRSAVIWAAAFAIFSGSLCFNGKSLSSE